MAELTISPDEIRDALKDFVKAYEPGAASKTEVGYVIDAADGIAHVEGLPGAMANELLQFEDGTLGLALNLDEAEIGVIVLGEFRGRETRGGHAALLSLLIETHLRDDGPLCRRFGGGDGERQTAFCGRENIGTPTGPRT